MNANCELKHEDLVRLLDYDVRTGVFRYRQRRGRMKPGDVAGTPHSRGYIQIRVMGRIYLAHVLAWFYVFGEWPLGELDHRDTDKTNNRIGNLRPATRAQNCWNVGKQKNNTSGFKGVWWSKQKQRWIADIVRLGTRHHLGSFIEKADAVAAQERAAKELHGEFSHGSMFA
jgi:hypothetical protein